MSRKDIARSVLVAEQIKPRRKSKAQEQREFSARGGGGDHAYHSVNRAEDRLAIAIDQKNVISKHIDLLERLASTKDVHDFLQGASPEMIAEIFILAKDPETPGKVKLEAARDILDRAGYTKVTKHAIARFDATTSKETIISSILGNAKILENAGIEIVDDDED